MPSLAKGTCLQNHKTSGISREKRPVVSKMGTAGKNVMPDELPCPRVERCPGDEWSGMFATRNKRVSRVETNE